MLTQPVRIAKASTMLIRQKGLAKCFALFSPSLRPQGEELPNRRPLARPLSADAHCLPQMSVGAMVADNDMQDQSQRSFRSIRLRNLMYSWRQRRGMRSPIACPSSMLSGGRRLSPRGGKPTPGSAFRPRAPGESTHAAPASPVTSRPCAHASRIALLRNTRR